jgi:hypothetical protein
MSHELRSKIHTIQFHFLFDSVCREVSHSSTKFLRDRDVTAHY